MTTLGELEVLGATRLARPLSEYRGLDLDDRAAMEALIVLERLKEEDFGRRQTAALKEAQEKAGKPGKGKTPPRAPAPRPARRRR